MPKQAVSDLAPLVEELVQRGEKIDGARLARIAEQVGKAFQVQPDEVAILGLTQKGRFLKFLLPEKLQGVGQIPLTSTSALAARTAREKRADIVNHFTVVPHASVFEAVPLSEERGNPIQKIMSAPIVFDGKVLGVIQVSRKGKNTASAGPDFTPQDLRELAGVAEMIAPCLQLCVPD
jgi:GAF domain-containing protein